MTMSHNGTSTCLMESTLSGVFSFYLIVYFQNVNLTFNELLAILGYSLIFYWLSSEKYKMLNKLIDHGLYIYTGLSL